jgi:hypothetical protein
MSVSYLTSLSGDIIAKLPPSWLGFATSLKHRRQEFSVTNLISTLVEEKARAKYTHGKKVFDEEGSSTILVQKKNPHASHNKKKNKPIFNPKVAMTFERQGKRQLPSVR